jgi:hypothetical protein
MNNTHTSPLSFEQIIDSHLTFITHLISQAQQAQPPTPQHLTLLISLQTHYQTHIDHLFDSLNTLTLHQRALLNLIPTTPQDHTNLSVKILFSLINDVKKTTKTTTKTRSYARTIASNFWVLWQPPIGNVTPYFKGLAPYGVN